jgi:hypothetical protein
MERMIASIMQTRRATGSAAGGSGGGAAGGGGGGDAGHTFEYTEGHPGCPILMGRKKKRLQYSLLTT